MVVGTHNIGIVCTLEQGCQMKTSIKSQTMLIRGQKKAKSTVQRSEKKPNCICGIALPLSQKKTFK